LCLNPLFKIVECVVSAVFQVALLLHQLDIRCDHITDQSVEIIFRHQSSFSFDFCRITDQQVHLRRPEIGRIHLHHHRVLFHPLLQSFDIITTHPVAKRLSSILSFYLSPSPLPLRIDFNPGLFEGLKDEFPYLGGHPGCDHIIVRLLLLKDQVHRTHIILRMTPVTL
jgi:hypothetical protein